MAHSVVHFEILADDLERAQKFYGDVFGWTFQAWGPPDFFLIHTPKSDDPGIVEGALAKRTAPAGDGVNGFRCTITVPDVAAVAARITEAGGTLLNEPMEIPTVGKVAAFKDSEGNEVAVMEYDPADRRHVKD
ncbi:hypothetical protein CCR85_13135 [Rhodothalassium salexigens]|uniref:VOC domain-containing protein n=1 Tax=Rhodothalassium salexigens DSM 2132 TaxID=1188247 RepID=A0A4R2P866_RHOSA|nr:VOC family protein [Rhodothalassium salexigens]MBB4212557.1 hypothetical protein [Rhodothalassium salexigens DSM 2132]MBK1639902.1 hypothetical protein [Rhodothalassium salexigens DSM 2132]MBK5912430.1 hypothetical protein [Rhodothalassium salexigens]MBK5919760.1 hypothetical protein [Rhodothalassium salexigens]TCP31102.1 hypothetical protein EV659_11231 [Rhodothalassium salexigens DSM 2132]